MCVCSCVCVYVCVCERERERERERILLLEYKIQFVVIVLINTCFLFNLLFKTTRNSCTNALLDKEEIIPAVDATSWCGADAEHLCN